MLDSDDILIDGAIDILLRTAKNDKNFFDMDIVQGAWYTDTEFSKNYCLKGHEENVHTATKLSGFPWGKIYKAELLEKFQFPEGYWFESSGKMSRRFISYLITNFVYFVWEED